jgi:hypothetical protein
VRRSTGCAVVVDDFNSAVDAHARDPCHIEVTEEALSALSMLRARRGLVVQRAIIFG